MELRIALVFAFLAIEIAAGFRHIAHELTRPLEAGDEIRIFGRGKTELWGVIRFEASSLRCVRQTGAVNPVVIKLYSRKRQISFGKKTKLTGCEDDELSRLAANEIAPGRRYTIKITITTEGYRVTLTYRNRERQVYNSTANFRAVDVIRARSGIYFYIRRTRHIELPLVSNCGVRPSVAESMNRIARGEDSVPGNYPWQAAIRRKYPFPWSPIIHMCGATLIDSCWILTAAHCTKRIRGREEDYYIRVGDFNNSAHAELRGTEDQQDIAIDKIFIHPRYSQSVRNPVNDVSLIKLKMLNGSTDCAVFSRYVHPACLPVEGSDDFPANWLCEISGWGASAYRQSASEFPEILQKGDIFLTKFEDCKQAFGNYSNGESRIRKGMVCAEGTADACQGDSGGPLACQRNRGLPDSPFVIWGITSWGEECAKKGKPGVYTEVVNYMRWITHTLSTYWA